MYVSFIFRAEKRNNRTMLVKERLVNQRCYFDQSVTWCLLSVFLSYSEHKTTVNGQQIGLIRDFTFTAHSREIFQSFSTDVAKFAFEPGGIRPNMAHGILAEWQETIRYMRVSGIGGTHSDQYGSNTGTWRENGFSTTIVTNEIAY